MDHEWFRGRFLCAGELSKAVFSDPPEGASSLAFDSLLAEGETIKRFVRHCGISPSMLHRWRCYFPWNACPHY